MALSKNAADFLARNPTLICTIDGDRFFEHPSKGDESTLICITREGRKIPTHWYDEPSYEEYLDWCEEPNQE